MFKEVYDVIVVGAGHACPKIASKFEINFGTTSFGNYAFNHQVCNGKWQMGANK